MVDVKNQETIRITILAVILAIFFGIKQGILQEKFDVINMDFALKFLSINFFQLLLLFYLFYFLILALNYGYKNLIKPKWQGFIFDFIITFTIIVIFLSLAIMGTIQLVIFYPDYIQAGWKTNLLISLSIVLTTIFFCWNLKEYFKKIKKPFKREKLMKKK